MLNSLLLNGGNSSSLPLYTPLSLAGFPFMVICSLGISIGLFKTIRFYHNISILSTSFRRVSHEMIAIPHPRQLQPSVLVPHAVVVAHLPSFFPTQYVSRPALITGTNPSPVSLAGTAKRLLKPGRNLRAKNSLASSISVILASFNS